MNGSCGSKGVGLIGVVASPVRETVVSDRWSGVRKTGSDGARERGAAISWRTRIAFQGREIGAARHLDYRGSLNDYVDAKLNIARF